MPVRAVKPEDAESILKIYSPYVANTSVTFETEIPTIDDMRGRIRNISSVYPWYVYEEKNEVRGYAYAAKHRERAAYRWSVDFAVYVERDLLGKGIGKMLFSKLIDAVKKLGYYNAFGVIALPNDRSIALHESFGFNLTGVTAKCGYKLGEWHDVGIWQLNLREADGEPAEPLTFDSFR
jgi:phosphinothricin acetyltransferase